MILKEMTYKKMNDLRDDIQKNNMTLRRIMT